MKRERKSINKTRAIVAFAFAMVLIVGVGFASANEKVDEQDKNDDGTIESINQTLESVNITGSVSLLWRYYTLGDVDSSPTLGDIDGDGKLEVVVGSDDNYVYALNGESGTLLWRYYTGGDIESSPALGDIDGDGKLEVVVGSLDNYVYAINGEDGSLLWRYYTGYRYGIECAPALGDIDGDGKLEVVVGSWTYYVYALNGESGSLLWKYYTSGAVSSSPALGDIDGDGKLEVVVGSRDNYVYALNGESGSLLWRYYTGYDIDDSSPALGDIDGDGDMDVVVGSNDNYVYALDSSGKSSVYALEWETFHHDYKRTGLYKHISKFKVLNVSTDKKEYKLGDTITLYLELNNSQAKFPVMAKFKLVLNEPCGYSDTVIETNPFILKPGFIANKTMVFPIPKSWFIVDGTYSFQGTITEIYTGTVLASDSAFFKINDSMTTTYNLNLISGSGEQR